LARRFLLGLLLCLSLAACGGSDHSARRAKAGATGEDASTKPKISLSSPVLERRIVIPARYTCAADVWLPIRWGPLPSSTREVVLYFSSYGNPKRLGQSETISKLVAAGAVIRLDPGLHQLRVGRPPQGASVIGERSAQICPPKHPGQRFFFTLYALSAGHRITRADLESMGAGALLAKIGRESEAIGEFAARYPG
jgi:hypothetical protein